MSIPRNLFDWPAIESALDVALGESVCPQFGERFERAREIVRGINKRGVNMEQTVDEKIAALETQVAALELWRSLAGPLLDQHQSQIERVGQFVNDVGDATVKANKIEDDARVNSWRTKIP